MNYVILCVFFLYVFFKIAELYLKYKLKKLKEKIKENYVVPELSDLFVNPNNILCLDVRPANVTNFDKYFQGPNTLIDVTVSGMYVYNSKTGKMDNMIYFTQNKFSNYSHPRIIMQSLEKFYGFQFEYFDEKIHTTDYLLEIYKQQIKND